MRLRAGAAGCKLKLAFFEWRRARGIAGACAALAIV